METCVEKVIVRREFIETDIDPEDLNIFSERKLVKNHLEEKFMVLNGEDFEANMLFHLKDELDYIDPYARLKIGKRKNATEEMRVYSENIMNCMDMDTISKLLYLCRLCSYLGGPGFPDFITIDKQKRFSLTLTQEYLLTEHKFFIIVSKLLGIDVRMVNVGKNTYNKEEEINIQEFLEEEMKKERFHRYSNNLEIYVNTMRVHQEMNKDDEIEFMREQAYKMPFFLMKKWFRDKNVKKEDFEEDFESFNRLMSSMNILVKTIKDHIRTDEKYGELMKENDENAVKKKYTYIMEKFGTGESRTKEILHLI